MTQLDGILFRSRSEPASETVNLVESLDMTKASLNE